MWAWEPLPKRKLSPNSRHTELWEEDMKYLVLSTLILATVTVAVALRHPPSPQGSAQMADTARPAAAQNSAASDSTGTVLATPATSRTAARRIPALRLRRLRFTPRPRSPGGRFCVNRSSRWRHPTANIPGDVAADCGIMASAATSARVRRRRSRTHSSAPNRRSTSK